MVLRNDVISKLTLAILIDHVTNLKWFPIQETVLYPFMLGQIGENALQLVEKQPEVVILFANQRACQPVPLS